MAVSIHAIPLGADGCYLLVGEGGSAVLVDAGMPGFVRRVGPQLAATGVPLDRIALVVITHGHWDHFGCANAIRELTGAKIAVHAAERERVERGLKVMPRGTTAWGRVLGPCFGALLPLVPLPPTPVDLELGDVYSLVEYGIPGRVIHTPGHSPGSVSVVLDSGEAFVGDLAMAGPPLRLKPGLPIFAEQPELLRASWERVLGDRAVTKIYPAHGKPFAAAQMRAVLDAA